jgi:tetratricopeptide (TPR) repeat protein
MICGPCSPCSSSYRLTAIGYRLLPAILVIACAGGPIRYTVVTPTAAEAISLLGDTLWGLPLDPQSGPARAERIREARERADKQPYDLEITLDLARATAGMGRLKDAVNVLTEASGVHPTDPRIYQRRGELLLWLRELDLAIADLKGAGRLLIGRPASLGTTESPDGVLAVSTLQYRTALLLGVAFYCQARYPAAREAFAEAANRAITPDEHTQAVLWLFFAVRRIGGGEEAPSVLGAVQERWAIGTRRREIELLLAYKGRISSDSIVARALAASDDDRALYSYGVGYYLSLLPLRKDEAESWLQHARTAKSWTSLPYLAAEADLARLRGRMKER